MKKIALFLILSAVSLGIWAVPAKPGQFKIITLADGSQVKVELCGDDHVNYWKAADGRTFVKNCETQQYELTDVSEIVPRYEFIQTRSFADQPVAASSVNGKKKTGVPHTEPIKGEMNGLVILCNFSDVKFAADHDNALYKRIVNELGYSDSSLGFVGSVRDYFLAQSDNQLDYEFDIVGPVDLPQTQHYYGQDSKTSQQVNMKQFVVDALNAAKSQIDFSKYDNDKDGWVDEVFFVYAGMGQADGGSDETIWPHMYYLKDGYGVNWSQNGVSVNVYACTNEIQGGAKPRINGIGTFCHEFSHCLGLPDFYDTSTNGDTYAMAYWSVMNSGCYLDNAFRPCGYTAYEREFCAWRNIQTLTKEQDLKDLPGIEEGGKAYKMINQRTDTEYFVLEPRTAVGWDKAIPAEGLLIYHIDYQKAAWTGNTINVSAMHPRCKVVDAGNDYVKSVSGSANDVFPSNFQDEFSDNSTPSTKLFNLNSTYDYNLNQSIYNISKGSDGRVSFSYTPTTYEYKAPTVKGSLFYESFNHCYGNGGNDDSFSGTTVGTGNYRPDQTWSTAVAHGGDKCAMFGKSSGTTTATTPEFEINGECILSFKVAPYGMDNSRVVLGVASGDATLETAGFNLKQNEWNECSVKLTGKGNVTISFSALKRFFLDEVLVMPYDPDGIETVSQEKIAVNKYGIYNLSGQKVGDNYHGVVIVNGKKVLR